MDIQKLCTILLLEADFNALNKIIFNTRVMPAIEKLYCVPSKVVGGRKS